MEPDGGAARDLHAAYFGTKTSLINYFWRRRDRVFLRPRSHFRGFGEEEKRAKATAGYCYDSFLPRRKNKRPIIITRHETGIV